MSVIFFKLMQFSSFCGCETDKEMKKWKGIIINWNIYEGIWKKRLFRNV